MTTQQEALRLALEALENSWTEPNNEQYEIEKNAITAIKEQLETKDEPVGKFAKFTDGIWREVTDYSAGIPLYTTPQRTWVGLTDEDKQKLVAEHHDWESLYFAIQAKLKELNT